MDPAHASSGFQRSIVLREGLASADVLAGARGSASGGGPAVVPGSPDLLATGISLGTPTFKGLTAAGGKATLRIRFKIKDRGDLPKSIQASVRWDPLDVPLVPTDPVTEVPVEPPMPGVEASPSPVATSAPPLPLLAEPAATTPSDPAAPDRDARADRDPRAAPAGAASRRPPARDARASR